jgi:hypothetical protein
MSSENTITRNLGKNPSMFLAKLLTRDEAQRIAVNIAKLPGHLGK